MTNTLIVDVLLEYIILELYGQQPHIPVWLLDDLQLQQYVLILLHIGTQFSS